jgi:hypothetical protein
MILELGLLLLATKIGNRGVNDWELQGPGHAFVSFGSHERDLLHTSILYYLRYLISQHIHTYTASQNIFSLVNFRALKA